MKKEIKKSEGKIEILKIVPCPYSIENRYIIVDENGYDVCGEHYTLKEAKQEIKFILRR
jgi:hypothetical protein